MLTDSHAHLIHGLTPLEAVQATLAAAAQAGVSRIINIATSKEELVKGIELKKSYDWIDLAAATHPHQAAEYLEEFDFFEQQALKGHCVAIGEIGLDYHYDFVSKDQQRVCFEAYLDLAQRLHLPVIIHCREAFEDFFAIMKAYPKLRGVLHCFTGHMQDARGVLDMGWFISFSGIVTFKKSVELQEIAKACPIESMLIETDSPYLAPMPYRGKENQPAYVKEVAQFMAALKEVSFEKVALETSKNATSLFS